MIVGARFPNVDVRGGMDVSADGWEMSPVGRGVADPADGLITSTGVGGTVIAGVSSVGDILETWLVGSTPCMIGDATGSEVVGTIGSKKVGGMSACIAGSTV